MCWLIRDLNRRLNETTVRQTFYDIVRPSSDLSLDTVSENVHGITREECTRDGRSLMDVMHRFLTVLRDVQPCAVVGHDVVGDIRLLVSEAIRIGMSPGSLFHLRRVLCTKELSMGRCRLPLPSHLQYEHPCDVLLERMNGNPLVVRTGRTRSHGTTGVIRASDRDVPTVVQMAQPV